MGIRKCDDAAGAGTDERPLGIALGVPIAAGVLYSAFGILLSLIIAALAMSLSSVSVVTNTLWLRRLHL